MAWLSGIAVLAALGSARAEPPTVHLGDVDIKDELFVRTDTCEVLPEDPDEDGFCDVVALGSRSGWHCTGIVVSPHLVLTARHCLPVTRAAWGHDTAVPLGRAGVIDTHEPPSAHLDVVLLELDAPLELRTHPWRSSADDAAPSADLRAIGFGADVPTGRSGRGYKRGVELHISRDWGCDTLRAEVTGCEPADEMVLGGNGARDTCDGDSGGPVFEPTDEGWRLVGIVSRPIRNTAARCGDGGIYTRVDRISTWLEEAVEAVENEPSGGSTPDQEDR